MSPHEQAYLKALGVVPGSSPTVGVLEQFLQNAGGTTRSGEKDNLKDDEWGAEPKKKTDLSDEWEGEVRI